MKKDELMYNSVGRSIGFLVKVLSRFMNDADAASLALVKQSIRRKGLVVSTDRAIAVPDSQVGIIVRFPVPLDIVFGWCCWRIASDIDLVLWLPDADIIDVVLCREVQSRKVDWKEYN